MKLDYIPSDEELEELLNAGVVFTEETLDNGYLAVNWECPSRRDWRRTLQLVKDCIPKLGRKFNSTTKHWIIAPDYIHLFEQIKTMVNPDSNGDFTQIDKSIESEMIANILGTEFRKMSARMRKKAAYVFDLYLQVEAGICPPNTRINYCKSEDTWGAFHPESGNWWYSDGRYSGYSPEEKDLKAQNNALRILRQKAKQLMADMSYLNTDAVYLPTLKQIFRNQMLDKYHHKCYTCGDIPFEYRHLHMHRVIPGKAGGEYIESNVVILCTKCHRPFEGTTWDEIHEAHNQLENE